MVVFQPELKKFEFFPYKLSYHRNSPTSPEPFPANWHSDFEFFYVVNGKGKLLLDSNVYTVSEGDVYVLNPYSIHRMYSDGDIFEYYFFRIPDNLFTIAHMNMAGRRIKNNVTDSETVRLFENYIKEYDKDDGTMAMRALAAAMYLIAYIIEKYSVCNDDEDLKNSVRSSKCDEVMAYVNTHYKEHISASVIADALGYNRSYLSREFAKHTGQTLTGYINTVRCVAAHEMLVSTKLSVSQVAAECGYNDVSHFNNTYKKFFGRTPAKDTADNQMKTWIYDSRQHNGK